MITSGKQMRSFFKNLIFRYLKIMLLAFNIIKGRCRDTKVITKREMELIFQEIALDELKQSQILMKAKKNKN